VKKPNIFEQFKALLEMIEPSDNYKGGSVSHEFAKEFYDVSEEYIKRLNQCLYKAQSIMTTCHGRHIEEYVSSEEYKQLREFINEHIEDTSQYDED
jgi:hypothetical protein